MGTTAGPRIKSDGIILYLDQNNIKSFANNQLRNMLTDETQFVSLTSDGEYIFNSYQSLDKFETNSLSSLETLSVYTRIRHTQTSIKGSVLYIGELYNQNDPIVISLDIRIPPDIAVIGSSIDGSNTASSTLISLDGHSAPELSMTGAVSHGSVISTSSISLPDAHTIPSIIATGSATDSSNTMQSTIILPDPHTVPDIYATSITGYNSNSEYELSIYSDNSTIYLRNKMPNYDLYTSYSVAPESDNSYLVNYSLDANINKIELFVNAENVYSSGVVDKIGSILTNFIQIMSRDGNSDYLQSGLKNVIVYNSVLTQNDISLFSNLKGN